MIWQDIEIEYKGKKAVVKPTIEFLNYLEKSNYSIYNVVERLVKQTLPLSWAMQIISDTLEFGGIRGVKPEDVIEELGGLNAETIGMVTKIVTACLPQPKEPVKTDVKKK
ncbi:MAG: hypothetical protein LBP40_01850 [Campylobacteraceae bacterium]|jgi:hypothetical protein|nr:hypothetical protein [Campylobacteraceae bacterium]